MVPAGHRYVKSQGGGLFTCSRVDGLLTVEVGINKSGYPVYHAGFLIFLLSICKTHHTVLETPLIRLSLTVTQVYIFSSPISFFAGRVSAGKLFVLIAAQPVNGRKKQAMVCNPAVLVCFLVQKC